MKVKNTRLVIMKDFTLFATGKKLLFSWALVVSAQIVVTWLLAHDGACEPLLASPRAAGGWVNSWWWLNGWRVCTSWLSLAGCASWVGRTRVCTQSMGLLESALKIHAEFSKYPSPAEDIALSCSQTRQCLFMKLHGKAEQGVYPEGSLLPFRSVNWGGSNPWFCPL